MARGRVRRSRRVRAIVALLVAALAATGPGAARTPVDRCLDLLHSDRDGAGPMRVEASLAPGGEEELDGSGGLRAGLEVRVAVDAQLAAADRLVVSLVSVPIDGEPELWQAERALALAPGDEVWILRATVELPEDFVDGAVHVADPASGRWGATRPRLAEPAAPRTDRAAIDEMEETLPVAADAAPRAAAAGAIRLVPPGAGALSGRVRVRALPGGPEVARVDFLLDGEVVDSDGKAPFSRTLDLGAEPVPRRLAVIAYSGDGRELGRDGLAVNDDGAGFDLRLRRVADAAGGEAAVAELSVPAGRTLAAVEFYRNEALLERRLEPPFRVAWPAGEPAPDDYLRAVARLDDGSTVEDVLMLAADDPGERVEVNLVQVFAVVTDRAGEPVEGLAPEDFTVRQGGREVELERFARADSVPLSLGLVVDTSESMWPLMLETKQAGAEFLVDTLAERDRAFLVDFDTRPRLAQALTDDLRALLNRFAGLEAGGFTALYDAIVFAMLHFDDGPGRRALVVLTDGDDYRSQFSSRRCIDVGQQLGVAVYFIDLSGVGQTALGGGWQWVRGGLPKLDLDGISAATGGRAYYITDLAELEGAYAEIDRELRSQYLLAFSSPRNLTAEELRSIEVRVEGHKGLKVRRVVGAAAG